MTLTGTQIKAYNRYITLNQLYWDVSARLDKARKALNEVGISNLATTTHRVKNMAWLHQPTDFFLSPGIREKTFVTRYFDGAYHLYTKVNNRFGYVEE